MKKLWTFFGLSAAISWGMFLALYFGVGLKTGPQFALLVFLFMWGPACAAMICGVKFRGSAFKGINMRPALNKATVLAALAPLGLMGLAFYISKAMGSDVLAYHLAIMDPDNPVSTSSYYLLFVIVFLLVTVFNGVFSISEELGFRGFALSEALPKIGFWKSSLVIGVFWGVWHLPLILSGYNYPGEPLLGALMITAVTVSITPLINYLTLKSGHVWSACLFHGAFNHLAGISVLMCGSGEFPHMGMIGIAGVLAGVISTIILAIVKHKELTTISYHGTLAANDRGVGDITKPGNQSA